MNEVLRAVRDGSLAREGIIGVLNAIADGTTFTHDATPPPCSLQELDRVIHEEGKTLDGVLRKPERREDALMGVVMGRVRGRIAGKAVAQTIRGRQQEVRP